MHAQSFVDRGTNALNEGKTKEAIRWFDWAIAADTTDASRYFKRGRAKRIHKNNSGATIDFKKAIELNNAYGDAYFLLALIEFETGDFNSSVKNNSLAIKHKTYYQPEAHLNRAQTYSRLGKQEKALKDFTKVIAFKDANLVNAYMQRGQLKLNMHDKKGALLDFGKVIELNPKNAQLIWDMGRISYDMEEFADAVSYYTRAMDLTGNKDPQPFMIRGEAFEKLKNYEAAIADYSSTIELKGNLRDAHYSRGQAKFRSGDKKGACVDWTKASELGHTEASGVIVYNCN